MDSLSRSSVAHRLSSAAAIVFGVALGVTAPAVAVTSATQPSRVTDHEVHRVVSTPEPAPVTPRPASITPADDDAASLVRRRGAPKFAWRGGLIRATVGRTTTVTARWQPARKFRGLRVRLELKGAGGRWKTVARRTTTGAGKVTLPLRVNRPFSGVARLRVQMRDGRSRVTRTRGVEVRRTGGRPTPKPTGPQTPRPPAVPTSSAAFEARLLELVNAVRATGRTCGGTPYAPVPPLTVDPALSRAAELHARDMGVAGYFSHVSLDGATPTDRAQASGYQGMVGENVAGGQETPERAMESWLESPGHCAAIMGPDTVVIGIGHMEVPNSPWGTYWVLKFGFEGW